MTKDRRNLRSRKAESLPLLDSQLGKESDGKLAARYNLGVSAVRARRVALGIPSFSRAGRPSANRVRVVAYVLDATYDRIDACTAEQGCTPGEALDMLLAQH